MDDGPKYKEYYDENGNDLSINPKPADYAKKGAVLTAKEDKNVETT